MGRRIDWVGWSLAAALVAPAGSEPAPAAVVPQARAQAVDAPYPPWQHGDDDPAEGRGVDVTVATVDVLADFHGSLDHPDLVLYVSGNYYFVVGALVAAFGDAYPQYRGHVYYETLPPGLLLRQMEAGGTVSSGNMTWTAKPDVFMAELAASDDLVRQGKLLPPTVAFVTNELTIMVPAGNPGQVFGLADLARPGLALAMPNPDVEGVARQIRASLVKAGGEALAQAVYGTKVQNGQTLLTQIHHRQTPLWLMQRRALSGVTWKSEAIFQERIGHAIGHVEIPPDQNTRAVYSAAAVPGAAHPQAARAWLDFLRSDAAFDAFAPFGFQRYAPPPR